MTNGINIFYSLEDLHGMFLKEERMEEHLRPVKPYSYQLQPSTYHNCGKASLKEDCLGKTW